MQTEPPIRAHYTLTEDDLVTAFREGGREALRKQQRLYLTITAMIVALFIINGLWNDSWSVFIALMALAVGVLTVFVPRVAERQLRDKLKDVPEIGRPITVTLFPDRIHTAVEAIGDSSTLIQTLDGLEARPGGLLLRPVAEQYVWIPDRAFATPDDRRHFHDRLRAALPLPDASL